MDSNNPQPQLYYDPSAPAEGPHYPLDPSLDPSATSGGYTDNTVTSGGPSDNSATAGGWIYPSDSQTGYHDPAVAYNDHSESAAVPHGYADSAAVPNGSNGYADSAAVPSGYTDPNAQPSAEALLAAHPGLAALLENMRLGFDNKFHAEMQAFKTSVQDDFEAIERQRDAARNENQVMRTEGQRLTEVLAATNAQLQEFQFGQRTQDPRLHKQSNAQSSSPQPPVTPSPKPKDPRVKKAAGTSSKPPPSTSPNPSSSRTSTKPRPSTTPPRSSPNASSSPSDLPSGSSTSSHTKPGATQGKAKSGTKQGTNSTPQPKGKQKVQDEAPSKNSTPRKLGQHQMIRSDIDPAAEGVKVALQTHIRFIGNCLASNKAPASASAAVVKRFELRFQGATTTDLIRAGVYNTPLIKISDVKLGVDMREAIRSNSKILKAFAKMEEGDLLQVKAHFAKLGVNVWAIDYTQSAHSVYNNAMRKCAIETFRFLCANKAYDFFTMDTTFLNDILLLTRMYDHFVHHHLNLQWQAEVRKPGGSEALAERNRITQARLRLYTHRMDKIDEFKLPSRFKSMFSLKGTSDDEGEPKHARALARPERSEAANQLVDAVEDLIYQDLINDGKRAAAKRRRERRSVPLEERNESQFDAVPKEMPIQYYDPSWYNGKPGPTRAKLGAKLVVAFPPGTTDFFSSSGNNRLSTAQLTAKYGKTVFSQYDLNFEETEEDTNAEDVDEKDEDEDGEGEGDGDSIGSQDSEEEVALSDAASMESFISDDEDADGSTDEEDDEQHYGGDVDQNMDGMFDGGSDDDP
ncbi:hypothetical protein R3P38DRAFT_2684430 [Favolaschia claudopus]|uniref:Uncharacterized protein n=1 Tax=Favolaschia claudopus TaxID=2862362 RepID=A0AAW0DID7_9AGAR